MEITLYTMIQETLKGLDTIDNILLVVKSSVTRLGAANKFVFQSIQNLFGKDVEDRFIPMFTFCDGKEPPAI